jgi:hypothetical protein
MVGGKITNLSLRRWLHSLPGVDKVGLEARAAGLGTRSIKTTSKLVFSNRLSMSDKSLLGKVVS